MSEYERLIKGLRRRGRKPLEEAERARRRKEQIERNRLRQEARRRAYMVLSHRHSAEFEELFRAEFDAITSADDIKPADSASS